MRLVKLIVTLIILGLIALFIGQNMPAWTGHIPFKFEIPLLGKAVWEISLHVVMLVSAFLGFIVGACAVLKPYIGIRKTLARERQGKPDTAPEAAK